MKIGNKYKRKLPVYICNGETVIITVTDIPKDDFNFHDFFGSYKDSQGNLHTGKFYLKDCESIKAVLTIHSK